MTINTRYNPKPIPIFKFDWEAWDAEDDDEYAAIGYGYTEDEAIKDLIDIIENDNYTGTA